MRLMFYCQHILGIGHLIRSMEIVKGLMPNFQICFINGGEVIQEFPWPTGLEVIHLPPIKTDSEFQSLQIPPEFESVEAVFESRKQQLLQTFDRFQPDVLMIELFPFGRRRFSPELIPLVEAAKTAGTKVVCSLRDIVVTKQDQLQHEAKICRLINQYFDLVLVHGDPQFMPLERSFTRVADLDCPVHYTGYVVQEDAALKQYPTPVMNTAPYYTPVFANSHPLILTSVGGGRFGHELLESVAAASADLLDRIPHHILMFTGPFCPEPVFQQMQSIAATSPNLTVERYTPDLLHYMRQADLSISMAGYNTTMNVLTTGVRSMLLPFTGNDDQEQTIRSQRLAELGVVHLISPEELQSDRMADRMIQCLQQTPTVRQFDLQGVEKTAQLVTALVKQPIPV
ncbi:MAG: glycosyl transferase [Elainella sp. Prado103]|nr:glycosyl transferase [Elainella sp. Prado103]